MIWGLMALPLFHKVANFWAKVCPKMLAFPSFLSLSLELALDKMLALSNKKSTFVLVSGFFGCCIFTVLFNYYLKGHF